MMQRREVDYQMHYQAAQEVHLGRRAHRGQQQAYLHEGELGSLRW